MHFSSFLDWWSTLQGCFIRAKSRQLPSDLEDAGFFFSAKLPSRRTEQLGNFGLGTFSLYDFSLLCFWLAARSGQSWLGGGVLIHADADKKGESGPGVCGLLK
jgi:hypothetical protein